MTECTSGTALHLQQAIRQFLADDPEPSVRPLGDGNINDTWLVEGATGPFVLQRINSSVFPRPLEVVANFEAVTTHIRGCQKPDQLQLVCAEGISTRQGRSCWQDPAGEVWRAQTYLAHFPLSAGFSSSRQIERLGLILACFHHLTADLDTGRLYDPIPGFHCTPLYLAHFDGIMSGYSPPGSADFRFCCRIIEKFRPIAGILEKAAQDGKIRRTTIHGDPKIDNFIVNDKEEAVGLLDLDTVGPGLLPYDLGDCLRSCCNVASERAADTEQIRFDIDICEALLSGYGAEVNEEEEGFFGRYLYEGVLLVSYELGLRFLTDHLQGDCYFKVRQKGENLQRALVQFRLVESIATQEDLIRRLKTGG
jgi:hypothetical protein